MVKGAKMGMDLCVYRTKNIDDYVILNNPKRAKEVLKNTNLKYEDSFLIDLEKLSKFIENQFSIDFKISYFKIRSPKWLFDFKNDFKFFILWNEEYYKLFKKFDEEFERAYEEDKFEIMDEINEIENEIKRETIELLKKQPADKLIEIDKGKAFIFKDKLKEFEVNPIVKLFYSSYDEILYIRKPFRWERTPSKNGIIYVDNWTGAPMDLIEELKKESYYEEGLMLLTSQTKKAQDLLIKCTNPEDRKYLKSTLPLKNDEFILITW